MRHSEGSISVDKTNFKFQAYLSNFNACIINRLDPKFPRYYLYLPPTSHHLRIRLQHRSRIALFCWTNCLLQIRLVRRRSDIHFHLSSEFCTQYTRGYFRNYVIGESLKRWLLKAFELAVTVASRATCQLLLPFQQMVIASLARLATQQLLI